MGNACQKLQGGTYLSNKDVVINPDEFFRVHRAIDIVWRTCRVVVQDHASVHLGIHDLCPLQFRSARGVTDHDFSMRSMLCSNLLRRGAVPLWRTWRQTG